MHRGRGTQARVVWCDGAAARAGIAPGQTLAAARARARDLVTADLDPRRLAEARRLVVVRLLAISPRIAEGGLDRFWVEPLREHDAWCAEARGALDGLGAVAIGVGPTATVAWAAACSVDAGHRIVGDAVASAFLDDAPLEVLELGSEALDVLAALGVRRVAQLRALDPISLGMRFGPVVADARRRLDGADARRPATPRLDDESEVRVDLDDAVDGLEPLVFLLQPAVERFASRLRARSLGATCVRLELRLDSQRAPHVVEVRTGAPIADGRALIELLRTRLERERVAHPIVGFAVSAPSISARREQPADFFDGPGRDPAAREVALDRLRSRFGDGAVRRASRVEVGPALARAAWVAGDEPARGEAHPWRALDPPAPVEHGVALVAGRRRRVRRVGRVERVTAPWWSDGRVRTELLAWAELDGPIVVLLRAQVGTDCEEDRWEVVAWVD